MLQPIYLIFLIFFMVSAHLNAMPYFHDFPDDGTREAAVAIDTFHEHALKSMDYNLNVGIPGFNALFRSKEIMTEIIS